jgi:hypothetical protein
MVAIVLMLDCFEPIPVLRTHDTPWLPELATGFLKTSGLPPAALTAHYTSVYFQQEQRLR